MSAPTRQKQTRKVREENLSRLPCDPRAWGHPPPQALIFYLLPEAVVEFVPEPEINVGNVLSGDSGECVGGTGG